MKEVWKDIKDYEGLYQVSNKGRVRRILFINNKTKKRKITILKPNFRKDRDVYEVRLKGKYIGTFKNPKEAIRKRDEKINEINNSKQKRMLFLQNNL